jgi:SAM-dependent methyltransferase
MLEEKTEQLQSGIKVSGKIGKRTVDQAQSYEQNRFAKRPRGRKLDKIDKAFAQRMLDMVGLESCIVDVPCGTGRFYNVFSKAKKLIMIDRDPNMLKVLSERYVAAENVQLAEGDITSLPLEDNTADLCFCIRLLHHIDSQDIVLNVLKELTRVSRKYVAFSFYNQNCWRYYSRKMRGRKITGYYYSFDLINKLAKELGLELIQKKPKINLLEQQCLVLFKKVGSSI